jgi:hypothetical protein
LQISSFCRLQFGIKGKGEARGKPPLLSPSPSTLRPARRPRPPVAARRPADTLARPRDAETHPAHPTLPWSSPCPPWAPQPSQHATVHLPRRHFTTRPVSVQRIDSLKPNRSSMTVHAALSTPTCTDRAAQHAQSMHRRSHAPQPRLATLSTHVCTAPRGRHDATPAQPGGASQQHHHAPFPSLLL